MGLGQTFLYLITGYKNKIQTDLTQMETVLQNQFASPCNSLYQGTNHIYRFQNYEEEEESAHYLDNREAMLGSNLWTFILTTHHGVCVAIWGFHNHLHFRIAW